MGAPAAVLLAGSCTVVLKVAATAMPAPFRVTVTGLTRPKLWQDRLAKDMLSLLAMKVSRLSPTDVTGDEPVNGLAMPPPAEDARRTDAA